MRSGAPNIGPQETPGGASILLPLRGLQLGDKSGVQSLSVRGLGFRLHRGKKKGVTWTPISSSMEPPCPGCLRWSWRGITFKDIFLGWIVGSYGVMLDSKDGGLSWSQVEVDVAYDVTLHSVFSVCDDWEWSWQTVIAESAWQQGCGVYAVGDANTLLYSGDDGAKWQFQDTRTSDMDLHAVHFANSTHGWVVGYSKDLESEGRMLVTTNAGKLWTFQSYSQAQPLHTVFFTNLTYGWAAGGGGLMLSTSDGGESWVAMDPCTSKTLNSLLVDENSGYGFAVGEDGVVCKTMDGGLSWETVVDGLYNSPDLTLNSVRQWGQSTLYSSSALPDCWIQGYLAVGHIGGRNRNGTRARHPSEESSKGVADGSLR
ncbi:hypothetical protein CYMTET_20396 [Cymbomonas tetramitiformis]|uniref:Photosynthesis system II assembly factor Ycf48/Hcf136-like domain-containing protein n=1 Tax=Cymbomonas tetramitiformis TaxID=36881 RepID=A0AAE0L417_9CHLO|nr:hypothetical protein CYMTET_20396 [Cymbomonas tetramitiformis]